MCIKYSMHYYHKEREALEAGQSLKGKNYMENNILKIYYAVREEGERRSVEREKTQQEVDTFLKLHIDQKHCAELEELIFINGMVSFEAGIIEGYQLAFEIITRGIKR